MKVNDHAKVKVIILEKHYLDEINCGDLEEDTKIRK